VSFIIVPAGSRALAEFAEQGPHWKGLFHRPLVGWVAGVALTELGVATAKVLGAMGQRLAERPVDERGCWKSAANSAPMDDSSDMPRGR
jgi:hypothetical protein